MLIQEYNPNWAINFEKIKAILNASTSNYIFDIQHVGSTSVPNLAAKPIIDIDIIYGGDDDFDTIKTALEKLGYYHNGNQGIEEREVFKRNGKIVDEILDKIIHHLYVCKADCVELQRHILFRDYLRKDEFTRKFYEKLKYEIAEETQNNKSKYAVLKQLKADPFIDYVIELEKRTLKNK